MYDMDLGAPRPKRGNLEGRISRIESAVSQQGKAINKLVGGLTKMAGKRQISQIANTGSRAVFTANSGSVAAGATGAISQTGNTQNQYRFVRFISSVPARFTVIFANGAPLFDGSNTVEVAGNQYPVIYTLNDPITLNGTQGFTCTFNNDDAAAAGRGTVEFSPVPFSSI